MFHIILHNTVDIGPRYLFDKYMGSENSQFYCIFSKCMGTKRKERKTPPIPFHVVRNSIAYIAQSIERVSVRHT